MAVDPAADLCTVQVLNAFEFKEITEVQNDHLKMLLEDGETRKTRRCKTFECSEMLLEDRKAGR